LLKDVDCARGFPAGLAWTTPSVQLPLIGFCDNCLRQTFNQDFVQACMRSRDKRNIASQWLHSKLYSSWNPCLDNFCGARFRMLSVPKSCTRAESVLSSLRQFRFLLAVGFVLGTLPLFAANAECRGNRPTEKWEPLLGSLLKQEEGGSHRYVASASSL
jgi:hypothetical protein